MTDNLAHIDKPAGLGIIVWVEVPVSVFKGRVVAGDITLTNSSGEAYPLMGSDCVVGPDQLPAFPAFDQWRANGPEATTDRSAWTPLIGGSGSPIGFGCTYELRLHGTLLFALRADEPEATAFSLSDFGTTLASGGRVMRSAFLFVLTDDASGYDRTALAPGSTFDLRIGSAPPLTVRLGQG